MGEHRNEHQLSTAARFADTPGIYVIHESDELDDAIQAGLSTRTNPGSPVPANLERLIKELRHFSGLDEKI